MTRSSSKVLRALLGVTLMLLAASCNEIARQSAPVELVVTNKQTLSHIDIQPTAANCNQFIGTVTVKSIRLSSNTNANLPQDTRFTDVRLTSYRVSWQRRDGGTLVPGPFVRATSGILSAGASTDLSDFLIFTNEQLGLSPFAALSPGGGGRDPETGRAVISMDAILEVFGETLAGDRVSGSTRMTLDFCYACNGCS